MQVHHDEGVANRIDPESCAAAREGISEALTGERIRQPLSRESPLIPQRRWSHLTRTCWSPALAAAEGRLGIRAAFAMCRMGSDCAPKAIRLKSRPAVWRSRPRRLESYDCT